MVVEVDLVIRLLVRYDLGWGFLFLFLFCCGTVTSHEGDAKATICVVEVDCVVGL